MADGFTYPGVYVQERPSTFSSVSHASTAVPAFLSSLSEFRLLFDFDKPYIKLGSWQDVETHITRRVTAMVASRTTEADFNEGNTQDLLLHWEKEKDKQAASAAPASTPKVKPEAAPLQEARRKFAAWLRDAFNYEWFIVRSLQAYFENGGGPCYVLAGWNDGAPGVKAVMTLKDVTLLVEAGTAFPVGHGAANRDYLDTITRTSAINLKICNADTGILGLFDVDIRGNKWDQAIDAYLPSTSYAAAYGPYLKRRIRKEETLSKTNDFDVLVPPSAVVAGMCCKVDRERGVWKAPANVNVAGPLRAAYEIPEDEAGQLNAGHLHPDFKSKGQAGPSINVVRCVRGSALTVWGARTLVTDDADFRYVPVRRLFDSVKRDILSALVSSAYEPNCQSTWERARAVIDHYLYGLWCRGALLGEQAQDAYTVAIGLGATMSEEDIATGLMKVKIGLAAVRPAEFIVLHFGQKVAGVPDRA